MCVYVRACTLLSKTQEVCLTACICVIDPNRDFLATLLVLCEAQEWQAPCSICYMEMCLLLYKGKHLFPTLLGVFLLPTCPVCSPGVASTVLSAVEEMATRPRGLDSVSIWCSSFRSPKL
jgi:hypothetical protein